MNDTLFDLHGKTALVTGASSGLGHHFAHLLAERGAQVILTARRGTLIEEAADKIRSNGGTALALVMDVTDERAVANAFSTAESQLGTINVVVNNAGIVIAEAAVDIDQSQWERVVDTNLKGVWLVSREAGRRLARSKCGGSLINVASILGLRVAKGVSSYAISKAGVIQMTRALSLEWARYQIRVNAIAPGYIETEMNSTYFKTEQGRKEIDSTLRKRLGGPEELDGTLLLLASKASDYITGTVITVDDGQSLV